MKNNINNHITCIGNAIVDVISKCSDEFLKKNNITKAAMNLIDEERSTKLYTLLNNPKIISGGSAANTAVGISMLGTECSFIGKVKNDELGQAFIKDIKNVRVGFKTPASETGPSTASSIILVTPDAERSMNTFLGACINLNPDDLDHEIIKNSYIVYLEGYLFDPPKAKQAFIQTAKIAKSVDNLVAMTLSDGFCVERHRSDFINFISNYVDILFCNDYEIKSLFQCGLEDAKSNIEKLNIETAITLGSQGSIIFKSGLWHEIEPIQVDNVEDTTGAGDLYAAGYLHGRSKKLDPNTCGKIASIAASEIISHIGPRPKTNLKNLLKNI